MQRTGRMRTSTGAALMHSLTGWTLDTIADPGRTGL